MLKTLTFFLLYTQKTNLAFHMKQENGFPKPIRQKLLKKLESFLIDFSEKLAFFKQISENSMFLLRILVVKLRRQEGDRGVTEGRLRWDSFPLNYWNVGIFDTFMSFSAQSYSHLRVFCSKFEQNVGFCSKLLLTT